MSLLFKAEVVYAPRALNKDILQANLINMLQTMPNSQETIVVWGLKVLYWVWHPRILIEPKFAPT